MAGRAIFGKHYTLSGTFGQVTLPAGASTATVTLTSIPNSIRRGNKAAILSLLAGNGYQLSSSSRVAAVTIVNSSVRSRGENKAAAGDGAVGINETTTRPASNFQFLFK
jgi:hypothetical protein